MHNNEAVIASTGSPLPLVFAFACSTRTSLKPLRSCTALSSGRLSCYGHGTLMARCSTTFTMSVPHALPKKASSDFDLSVAQVHAVRASHSLLLSQMCPCMPCFCHTCSFIAHSAHPPAHRRRMSLALALPGPPPLLDWVTERGDYKREENTIGMRVSAAAEAYRASTAVTRG